MTLRVKPAVLMEVSSMTLFTWLIWILMTPGLGRHEFTIVIQPFILTTNNNIKNGCRNLKVFFNRNLLFYTCRTIVLAFCYTTTCEALNIQDLANIVTCNIFGCA